MDEDKRRNTINRTVRKFDLEKRLLKFAVQICDIAEALPKSSLVSAHVAHQLIRSGTSPASNYGEAQSAESRKDFIHKLKICLKELRETHIWLQFLLMKKLNDPQTIQILEKEADELISIFVKSIETAKRNMTNSEKRTPS
ncbi:MAG: four helix bundle protein [Rhodothermales bacterium]